MTKRIFVFIFLSVILNFSHVFAESSMSPALSRMEREWFHREFNFENDEIRISRLEEKVFGTIHDVDLKIRYQQLCRAFDSKKSTQAKYRKNYLYGVPTSDCINIDDLLRGGNIIE